MQVHHYPGELPNLSGCVLTIGTFDGVHLGHRSILRHLTQQAYAAGTASVLVTFHPHPRHVIKANTDAVKLLNTQAEKLWLLRQSGVDHVVIVPFTPAFAALSAEAYVKTFLVQHFQPSLVVVGYDHRFGSNRSGNLRMLQEQSVDAGFGVNEIPAHLIDESAISSTRIRQALAVGEAETANEALGYTYSLEGTVGMGRQLGRTIGYPTANLAEVDEHKLLPADGVYAAKVRLHHEPALYHAMLNIGNRPTVGGVSRSIEAHLFDYNESCYNAPIRIFIAKRLRNELKFSGLDALKAQLAQDELQARNLLQEYSWQLPMIPV